MKVLQAAVTPKGDGGQPPPLKTVDDAFIADGTVSERSLRYTIEAEKKQLKLVEDVPFSRVADFSTLYEVLAEQRITPAEGSAR